MKIFPTNQPLSGSKWHCRVLADQRGPLLKFTMALSLSFALLLSGTAGEVKTVIASEIPKEEKITTDHWSYQPVRPQAVPHTGDARAQGAIDEFILAKLRRENLEPSPEADRPTLIRRLYLVMHGMPPAPEEVEKFVNDPAPDAYGQLVDRVLASSHYGERWARHWLDVVRYADSNGFETNRLRNNAWPYRDYVIASFNSDKPYDQFIREQLAGDALGEDAATGFLVAGAHDIVASPDINLSLAQRQDDLADMVNTTGTAFLGLTMGCARCHTHKFDPILHKDYFAMQAVFAGVSHGERALRKKPDAETARILDTLRKSVAEKENQLTEFRRLAAQSTTLAATAALRPPVNPRLNVEEFPPVEASAVRFTINATTGGAPCVDEIEIYDGAGNNIALASAGGVPSASGSLKGYDIHRLEHLNDGKAGNSRSWISDGDHSGWVMITFPKNVTISRIVWGRDRNDRFTDRLATDYRFEAETAPDTWTVVSSSTDRAAFTATEKPDDFLRNLTASNAESARQVITETAALRGRISGLSEGGMAWVGTFSQPAETHRLNRGDPLQPREVVAPDVLTVLGTAGMAVDEPEQQRRVKLGNWISSPENPLTARVMVNRLWHYIFGQGIVDTPSDLGVNGSRPTHPALLDWMASEFVKSGWSVKHMQRLILLSSTFRQSSLPQPEGLQADAGARLLWRYPPRRMEAEAIRDSMLTVSGALNPESGGPGFYLMDVEEENVMHYHPKEKFTPAEFRRMVYQTRIRQTTDSVFGSFDCPDGSQVTPRRSRSNTPLQALNLFNSRFVLQQADILAQRLTNEEDGASDKEIRRAFELFYSRLPDEFELSESRALIRQEGLPAFCRALYNTSEFLFIF